MKLEKAGKCSGRVLLGCGNEAEGWVALQTLHDWSVEVQCLDTGHSTKKTIWLVGSECSSMLIDVCCLNAGSHIGFLLALSLGDCVCKW